MTKHLSDFERQAVVDDFREGADVDDLAQRYSRSVDSIRRVLNRAGIQLRDYRKGQGWQLSADNADTVSECSGVPTHYVVGYRRGSAAVILWQGTDAAKAERACRQLQACESYERVVVESARIEVGSQKAAWRLSGERLCPNCFSLFRMPEGTSRTEPRWRYCCQACWEEALAENHRRRRTTA